MFHPVCDACPWSGTPTLDIQDAKRQGLDHWDDHQALFSIAEIKDEPEER